MDLLNKELVEHWDYLNARFDNHEFTLGDAVDYLTLIGLAGEHPDMQFDGMKNIRKICRVCGTIGAMLENLDEGDLK